MLKLRCRIKAKNSNFHVGLATLDGRRRPHRCTEGGRDPSLCTALFCRWNSTGSNQIAVFQVDCSHPLNACHVWILHTLDWLRGATNTHFNKWYSSLLANTHLNITIFIRYCVTGQNKTVDRLGSRPPARLWLHVAFNRGAIYTWGWSDPLPGTLEQGQYSRKLALWLWLLLLFHVPCFS